MKRYKGCTSSMTSNCNKDLVYDLFEQHYSSESDFVRNVPFDDSVMSVIGLEQTLNDFVLLGIPTFNLAISMLCLLPMSICDWCINLI